jgi:capsid protein
MKMEFDKSRVFTALNADELKVGSKVLVAYNLETLETHIATNKKKIVTNKKIVTINRIYPKSYEYRFGIAENDYLYPLAYLVSEPEEKKLKVSDLKLGDIIRYKLRNLEYLVIGINHEENVVFFDNDWHCDEELWNWEKVE